MKGDQIIIFLVKVSDVRISLYNLVRKESYSANQKKDCSEGDEIQLKGVII